MSTTGLPDADRRRGPTVAPRLFLVWQDPETRSFEPVGALVREAEGSFVFRYLRRAERLETFHPLASFPRLDRVYRFTDLPPFFENRVMSPRRPDYPAHVRALSLGVEDATPFELLARTGGSRATDTFHVVAEPTANSAGWVRTLFLASGVRHVPGATDRIARLRPGDLLHLRAEPDNEANPRALLIDAEAEQAVGYVPDWMLEIIHTLTEADPDHRLTVELANGPDIPPHLRLLCRLEARLPPDARPLQDPDFDYVGAG